MNLVVHAGMAREIAPISTSTNAGGPAQRLRRAAGIFLVPIAYLGAVVAFPYVIGITFLLLTTGAGRFGPEAYWMVAGAFTVGVLWLIWVVCRSVIRHFGEEVLDIDAIAILISLVLSLLVMAYVVGTRGPDPGPNQSLEATADPPARRP